MSCKKFWKQEIGRVEQWISCPLPLPLRTHQATQLKERKVELCWEKRTFKKRVATSLFIPMMCSAPSDGQTPDRTAQILTIKYEWESKEPQICVKRLCDDRSRHQEKDKEEKKTVKLYIFKDSVHIYLYMFKENQYIYFKKKDVPLLKHTGITKKENQMIRILQCFWE